MPLIEYIISTIAPHLCLGCQKEGRILCSDCLLQLPVGPIYCPHCGVSLRDCSCNSSATQLDIKEFRVATVYYGVAKELVHVLKFGRARQAAECIGEAMLPMLGDLSGASLVVSYIPTATNRVRQRGYDQSALIARHVARQLGLPFRPLLCRRGRQRQLGKNRSQRATQLASVFWTNKNLTNTEILLIDDVITTGSSMHAAGRILTQAGASRIITAAFAHA